MKKILSILLAGAMLAGCVLTGCSDSSSSKSDSSDGNTAKVADPIEGCLLYTSPSPRDA